MLIENIDPVLISLGPLEIRWYGVMMALSFLLGSYFFIKNGKRQGLGEDVLFNLIFSAIIGGVIGARLIFVLTNLDFFIQNPGQIIRVDTGGLAFHGALLGGVLSGWLVARLNRLPLHYFLDLAVPGLAVGYMLVRWANIFNQEILGRPAELLFFDRHPAQIYGILIGLICLLAHNYLSRRFKGNTGVLFWGFIFYYSLLRGLIEETFRDNPLYLWGFISENWGAGFFTLTHLATPPLLILAWFMLNRARKIPELKEKKQRA